MLLIRGLFVRVCLEGESCVIAQKGVHRAHTVHLSSHEVFSFLCPQCPSHPHYVPQWGSVFRVLTSSANFLRARSVGGVSRGMNAVLLAWVNAMLLSPAAGHLDINIWFAAHFEYLATV